MPTKLLVFSDHHAHNFAYGSERKYGTVCGREGYYNSRFLASLDVLAEVKRLAAGKQAVLFGGDLFHQRSAVSTDVLMGTYAAIKDITVYSRLIMIPGNHDYNDREGRIHSLLQLENDDNIQISDYSNSINDHVCVHTISYCENKSDFLDSLKATVELKNKYFKDKFNILLCHQGVQGGVVGSDYVLTSSNDLALDEIPDEFNLVLIGHFHKHQKLKEDVYFIGSSHQHNWGDANDIRGFLDIVIHDDNTYTLTQLESNAPRFIISDKPVNARNIDFVRSTSATLTAEDFGKPKVFENIEVTEDAEDKDFETPTFAVSDILDSWALAKKVGEDYLEVGKELIKEAQNAR